MVKDEHSSTTVGMASDVSLTLIVLITLSHITEGDNSRSYTGIYSTFPLYKTLPSRLSDALAEGYTLLKQCDSSIDEYGNIYSKTTSEFLPGLMYNTHGQLSGMVFAVNQSALAIPNEVSLTINFCVPENIANFCGFAQISSACDCYHHTVGTKHI